MLGLSGPGPPQGPSTSAAYSATNHLGPTSAPSSDSLLLTLRAKPHARVFRALFQYLPLRDSPNENPQLELSLQPGDVILVKGEMDTDGFYRGETLDGRTGLVPSNYVERVPDSVLLANARAPSPSFPLHVPQHLAAIQHDFSSPDHSTLPDSVCPYPPADVTKVTVQEIKNNETPRVPCPRELIVEKKLSRSVLVSWSPPEESFVAVSQYHVCVDAAVRAIVPGSFKCRALVEDVALEGCVNLSVRAVSEQGHSPDAACTVAIGHEAPVAPQQVRVWSVTPVSACVRWYPSNSNAEHVVSLNAVKVGVCPPTVFQVQLQGLCPSTIYRISVRTKHPKAVLEQRPVERCIDFKTLPKIGLPDPPTHVQVEVGPQPGTLLVSWKSVTNQPKPPSRAAVHSYLIYADGKNIAQVPNETADHVLLRLADLSDDPPIFITVRTKTKEGAVSSDSNVARVPRTPYNQGVPGPIVENPLLLSQSQQPPASLQQPQLIDMTSSYPSYTTANPTGIYGQTMVPSAPNLMLNGHLPTAPYTAPSRLVGATGMMTSYQQPTSAVVQPFATVPPPPTQQSHPPATSYSIYDRSVQPNKAQLLMSQPSIAKIPAQMPPAWKTSQMSQYYTFHPSFLHTEPSGPEENRPSVLEMENSYLMRHRQSEWANAPDARARIEAYARGIGRAGSADERSAGPRHRLVPPRLARVKSESGFGTRSEPDLRPPTLDDDCRWFVALFDYSHHMSPNANAETEELSFRKHQLIKVFGDVDPDGFYTGQIGSRVGLVPSNMVIEIAKDDLAPRRTVTAAAAEPTLRRMRWGSLKSRSYDHAGDRVSHHRAQQNYASLDRRDDRPERSERHRRTNGRADYDYSRRDHDRDRDYDDRYMRDREASREPRDRRERDMRDDYRSRDRDYRDRDDEEYGRDRYRDRDRDRDHRERDRGYDDRMRRPEAAYSRDRDPYAPESGFRRDRSQQPRGDEAYREDPARTVYDYPPGAQGRYEPQIPGSSNQMHQNPSQMNQMNQLSNQMGQMQMGGPYPTQQPQQQQPQGLGSSSALGGMGGAGMMPTVPAEGTFNGLPVRKMVAKFDYDSRQLSPNVDAEQVELSFRQGDVIVVYGEMDEDGFYMGELNGLRGLVPSNFLQSSPLTTLGPSQPTEPMRKGVAFSDMTAVRRNAPVRQTSQTSTGAASGSTTAAAKPAAKKSTAGQSAKPLTKKTSDVGKNSVPNARKTSTAVKKSDSTAKKK